MLWFPFPGKCWFLHLYPKNNKTVLVSSTSLATWENLGGSISHFTAFVRDYHHLRNVDFYKQGRTCNMNPGVVCFASCVVRLTTREQDPTR